MKHSHREPTSIPRTAESAFEGWLGRAVVEPSGRRLGHVADVEPDGMGGAWLVVRAEWGVLDWLPALGGGSEPLFTFHSNTLEEKGVQLCLRHPAP